MSRIAIAALAGLLAAALAAAAERSPLQARIDQAAPGSTLLIEAGTYHGDLVIDRPLRLVGGGRPLLIGSGRDSVVRIRAPRVSLVGFDIDGRGGGDLGRDTAGVHVAAPAALVADCRIRGTLFGVYLHAADRARVERCDIRGIPDKEPGEKGSGIHVWNSHHFSLRDNRVAEVRDGFYIQSSNFGVIAGNQARELRYGLHYMFSDDNRFEGNTFADGDAGTAVMYSRRIVFRRNRFVHNRGFASVGLLLRTCDDVIAEDNLIHDNARGIFLEGSYRNQLRGNLIAASDTAVVLYDSCGQIRFEDNAFVGNLSPLLLVGRRTDTVFSGNYWSDNPEPDLDGDGRSDRPYRLSSVFDHFRGNLTAADLFTQSFAAGALAAAERTFPVLQPVPVEDRQPRVRPPARALGLAGADRQGTLHAGGLLGSLLLLALGAAVLVGGRRAPARNRP
jgi:nitrous oxidase accessory protein